MARPSVKNLLIAFLALTTLTGGALAWNQYVNGVRLRGQLLTAGTRADLEKQLQDLQKRRNELEAEVAGLRARRTPATDAETAADPAATAGPGSGRFGRPNRANFLANLMENPEFSKLWTSQQKARITNAFAPLIKNLNLTPEQATQFQGLLAERQMSMMDALASARSEGITGRAEVGGVVQQAASQIDGQIQALLGPDGYSQYQNFVQTQPQRNQVNQLQVGLIGSGNAPLQDYQVQQLTQILAQNSTAGAGGAAGGPRGVFFADVGGMGGALGTPVSGPPITQEAVNQAASILTPVQMQQLQLMEQEQATQRQIFDFMRQGFGRPAAPAGGTATSGGAAPAPARPPSG